LIAYLFVFLPTLQVEVCFAESRVKTCSDNDVDDDNDDNNNNNNEDDYDDDNNN